MALVLAFASPPAQAAPFAYVTSSSGPPGYLGEVFQYDIGAGGQLTPLSPPTVAVDGRAGEVAVSPDGKSIYVTGRSGPPGNVGEIFQYDVGAGGTLSPKTPPTVATGDLAPGAVAVSPDGKSAYVIGTLQTGERFEPSYVLQYDIGAGGALSPKTPPTVPAGGSAFGVAVSPDGKSVYVATACEGRGPGFIFQYDVGADGTLSPKDPTYVSSGFGCYWVAITPDGKSVYVDNYVDGIVSQYDVGTDGTLSPKSPPAVNAGVDPRGIAVSPDGKSAYVADSDPFDSTGSVSQYDVGADGALSPKTPPRVPTGGSFPFGVAVSPDGKSVYVTNPPSNNVSQYDVGAGGALSPKSPPTVAAGIGPLGIAVTPLARVPTHKEQCKGGGWRDFPQFRNQGGCVSFVEKHR